MASGSTHEMVLSYTRVRLALGILGLFLPFALIIGGILEEPGIAPTISDFFHTTYRDLFVGTLTAIGVFLVSYQGYKREPGEWIDDDWLATAAGLAAFGMAFFPTPSPTGDVTIFTQHYFGSEFTPVAHYVCALIFFGSISAMCFFKFAKTTRPKRRRIYIMSGSVMLTCLTLTAVAVCIKNFVGGNLAQFVLENRLIFWFEAVGVWAFGLSWIVKSKADLAFSKESP